MKMSGTRQLAAPQREVWAKLNDPGVLQRCIPGCESLEKVADSGFKATAAVKLGPMALRFSGDVTLSDLNPPHSYRITGSGKAGPAGFAAGGADVRLEPKDGGTLLSYDVDANVGGKIAQLGSRLIDATAASMAGQFFDAFAKEVEQPAMATAGAAPQPTPTAQASAGLPGWLWLALAIAALLGVLYSTGVI